MQTPASLDDASSSSPPAAEAAILRALRLVLGYFWAITLGLAGLWIIAHRMELLNMLPAAGSGLVVATIGLCLAGAQLVFMLLVADDLCPDAPVTFTAFIKTFAGSIVWMCIAWIAILLWQLIG